VAEPPVTFAGLLRKLRSEARLTQEDLAEASGVRPRSISDLERGIATNPRKDTIRLLADALGLTGSARAEFEAVARGRFRPAGSSGAMATRTLPRDISSFTGRQQELQVLADAADSVAGSGGVVGIHAIGGMAGVGKTAFAVHAAYRLADRFPNGQIFVPLHGHTPGQQPLPPADALAGLLLTAGVPAAQIPPDLQARMAMWRDRVAGQRMLLVLDDAVSSEQIRPLLPGAGDSMVLVTSRRHLSALDDVTTISLDVLPAHEAAALLVRLSGRTGLSSASPAVAELIRLCGYLPLAIGMVARQLHHHPAWSPEGWAAELVAARDRLELIATENLSVAAAFDLSYGDLIDDQQRLFRRLGLHPGTEVDAFSAAALDGTGADVARRGLEALYDQYLLTETAQGRYRLHDLLREHARALAGQVDLDRDRDQAITRLLDYYQHTAALAEPLLARQRRPRPTVTDGPRPAAVPAFTDREHALTWVRAERASLLACLEYAASIGQDARVVTLTAGLAGLLRLDGPWAEAITRHTAALQAAQRLGDRLTQANVRNDLGVARRLAGDYPGATQDLGEALRIYRDLGHRLGEANALSNRGNVRRLASYYPEAAADMAEALGIYRGLGDRAGQGYVLYHLGSTRLMSGDYPGAVGALEEALGIFRELGDRLGQGDVLSDLGNVRTVTGDYLTAIRDLEEAFGVHGELGNPRGQANALTNLGDVRQLTGDYQGAIQAEVEALRIHRDLGSRRGEANALFSLGSARLAAGDYPGSAQALEEALDIYRDIADRGGEVTTLNEIATLRRARGDLREAEAIHRQALRLAREIGSAWDEASALAGLGRCARAAGRTAEAADHLRQAVEIYQRIGAAQATALAEELASASSPAERQNATLS
jgi:tetratricopeptide (TPR) repeat protein/transcriptional regulator with XRE-family HTH domain